MAEQAQGSHTPLACDAPPALPYVGDEFRLEQVITNLISNALRYAAGKPVSVTLSSDTAEARICVRDRGPGIAPADQERIFEQFERGGSAAGVQGLGLGLYISREIVRAHGGRLLVESVPGEGAAFTVALPVAAPQA
jgi:signal transduction histidine kinase